MPVSDLAKNGSIMTTHGSQIVEIEITFECPKHHRVSTNFTHIQSPGSSREVDGVRGGEWR